MLKVYTLEEDAQWDRIVRSFRQYDVYWLSGYVKAFKIHGDGEPLLFYYEDASARGMNAVMKRGIAKDASFGGVFQEGMLFDFATPYGYGGWMAEGEDTEQMFRAYEKWCSDNKIVSEFVRFHPVIRNHEFSQGHYEIIPLGNTVAMDLSSPEVIWENLTSKNRNKVRKAQKNGVQIFHGRSAALFEEFRKIYNETMDKDHAGDYYYFKEAFYESILNDLPHHAQVFYAVYENKVIAASIMLSADGKMNYHLSGSLKEYSHFAPTNLLLYEAALWGCANGCRTLYLGGGVGSGKDSLYQFKKGFYRKDDKKRFYIGKKIFNQELYDRLSELHEAEAGAGLDSQFFPRYRA